MTNITIDNITIKQDKEGRYCLNDFHKAAGGLARFQPARFLRLDTTSELVEEILNTQKWVVKSTPDRYGGTFVCKELVYAYAMWISPSFHLKVIRAYDRLATQGVAVHENAAEDLLKNPLKYIEALMNQAKTLQEENRVMHKELNEVTVDEYRALTHRYFTHGQKTTLGKGAAALMRSRGLPIKKQERTLNIHGKERQVELNVYPREILEKVEMMLED